jgi:hypothetical protein
MMVTSIAASSAARHGKKEARAGGERAKGRAVVRVGTINPLEWILVPQAARSFSSGLDNPHACCMMLAS